ncbi:MAG: glycosyltransferase, partial [Romboutsia sp.]|uniref:glycosyltransferase n=1 Tax=Romboutsia sp. TaxID=1965302 RepID=UPI003F2F5C4D
KSKFTKENYITLVDLPKNVGFSGAVSIGLFSCSGEFIAFHDGDDISHELRIEKQVNFLKSNNHLSSVGCNYLTFNDSYSEPIYEQNGIVSGEKNIREIYSHGGHCVCYGTLMFRGEIFDKIGGLSRRLDFVEDYEYITKLIPYGIDNLNESLYYYRKHSNQRSKNLVKNNCKKIKGNQTGDIKVLIVLDRFNIGGTETHVLSLVKGLLDKDVKVVLVSGEGPLQPEFEKLDCKIYNIDFPITIMKDKEKQYEYEREVKKIIEKEHINMVHAHQSPSGCICLDLCRKLGIATVFTIHGLYYQDIVSDKLHHATEVISVSSPVYDWLLEYGVISALIPNFIDFDNFTNATFIEDVRAELNIDKNAFVVLYCSRIAWGKTRVAENLIRVCRDIRRLENIDIHTIIIGDGPDFARISYFSERANSVLKENFVHILGAKTILDKYYSSCDCVVGTGRVAIEAMAFNKPVIASGNMGYFGILTPDNIEESWESYFGDHKLKNTNSPSYLYRDLKSMIFEKNNAKESCKRCNSWSREMFDTSSNIDNIIKIYNRAIKRLNKD